MTDELARMARRLVLALLLACAALAVIAGGAQAVVVTVDGHRLSYQPLRGAAERGEARPNVRSRVKPASKKGLTWHGGPVMSSNTNYAIYWDPAGGSSFPAGYEAGIDKWFGDIEHDSGSLTNTDSVLAQYHGEGSTFANYDSHFAGPLIDTDPYPANGCNAAPKCFTREQIEAELASFVQGHGLPADLQHMYFLLTPEGVESCLEEQGHSCSAGAKHAFYCMYHDYIELSKGGTIVFANAPYVPGLRCGDESNTPNNKLSDEEIAGGIAHEHSEGVTDPTLKAWYETSKGNEVADKCRTFQEATEYGAPLGTAEDGSKYNQLINGDKYWYQQEWSNEAEACKQRALGTPAVTKVAPKTGPASGGTAVTISGSGFTSTSTVAFGTAAASEVVFHSPSSITATSPPGSTGVVDVRVTNGAGTSPVVSKDHFKYKKAR
jgi:hypothetical protein